MMHTGAKERAVADPGGIGDAAAFDALYQREWAGLVALGWSLTGSWAVAEELAQDAFADAYRRWDEVGELDRPDLGPEDAAERPFDEAGDLVFEAAKDAHARHHPPPGRDECDSCYASETSTGVAHDVKALADIVKNYEDTILVVDAITALGVLDLKTDAWGLDVVVTGSQKALMLPPGLAFASVSSKAWRLAEKAKNATFYFNFKRERDNQQKNTTAYTPAVSLIIGLKEVLNILKTEGLESVFARHAQLARAMREGVKAAGLELFPKERPSDALTAICAPQGVDGQAIYKNLRTQYGMTAAGGQDHLKGKIFRISHMGYIDSFDVITALAAVEMVVKGLGHPVKLGSGVAKAQEILMGKA